MKIVKYENIDYLRYQSKQLLQRMLSPFCGLNQEVGYVSRTSTDFKLMVGSAALTGIHVLFNRENPGRGAYHIGGTGIFPDESMIRILGESIERYSQLMSDFIFSFQMRRTSYETLVQEKEHTLDFSYFNTYSNEQYAKSCFPFQKALIQSELSWIKMFSCYDSTSIWVPAQMILVGYDIKKTEPWITSAVTTGTAAHTNYLLAFKAALLELFQLDTIMGHWYTNWQAYKIELDVRLNNFISLLKRYSPTDKHNYQFYYIPNPDLEGFTIACIYLQKRGMPKVVIGLGADFILEKAIYKAFLETVASVGLGRMVVFKGKYEIDKHKEPILPDSLYDLDRNVEYYGNGNNFSRIEERFLKMPTIKATDLPPDNTQNDKQLLKKIIETFKKSNKALYFLDLTSEEQKTLGFKVVRVWSPHTLSLCLPSAPQIEHHRFKSFGGLKHAEPHPYP